MDECATCEGRTGWVIAGAKVVGKGHRHTAFIDAYINASGVSKIACNAGTGSLMFSRVGESSQPADKLIS